MKLSERMDELEARLTFQEDTIAQLNDVITRQDADIRRLLLHMRELSQKYSAISGVLPGGTRSSDDKPPHY
ncbi:SlyX family protein [Microbulbifer sp. 2205BS26-8]|uniref:SlyX family protein n=1 Tax=Microbulbifer sp. 2205BS26-8 TaxID=3064386 RepID=UPI00273FE66C|nr:SlyX family protein [Microbulbifer sp. 2205BS26-8]MDP5208918.1 SlyX family protein [Microbulbifer sp. 2205BS26-8]